MKSRIIGFKTFQEAYNHTLELNNKTKICGIGYSNTERYFYEVEE